MDKVDTFFRACRTGKTELIRDLISQGIDPNCRDEYDFTGLIWAGRKGKIESAGLLLELGANIELGDIRNRTALFHAAVFNRQDFVKYISSRGANVNPVDTHGCTPLDTILDDQMVSLLKRLGCIPRVRPK